MANKSEIAAMAQNVIADDATLALLVELRKLGKGGNDGADLIEWLIDNNATYAQALAEEREWGARLAAELDEAVGRLNRLGDHLRTLTHYAEATGYDDAPPPDPFPAPPEPEAKSKRGKRS